MKNMLSKKYFHILVVAIIILILVVITLFIMLRYSVEGESNMPFELSKISIISTSQGVDKPTTDTKWAFDICQNNDIYIYIDKNKEHSKEELIKYVSIENIQIEAKNKDNIKLYKPDEIDEKMMFKNTEENKVNMLEYLGNNESNLKTLKISNQGGMVAFRCSNEKIAEYKSNEEVINHNELLKKSNISNEDLKINIKFDLIIKLEKDTKYKSTIKLELPSGNIIETGTNSKEYVDNSKIVFKKIK